MAYRLRLMYPLGFGIIDKSHRAARTAESTPLLGGRRAIRGSKPALLLVPAQGILVILIPGQDQEICRFSL